MPDLGGPDPLTRMPPSYARRAQPSARVAYWVERGWMAQS